MTRAERTAMWKRQADQLEAEKKRKLEEKKKPSSGGYSWAGRAKEIGNSIENKDLARKRAALRNLVRSK